MSHSLLRPWFAFLLLAAFGILTGYLGLSSGSLRLWDEALTAERSREMLVLGNFVTPHLGFQPDFNKPPLYYTITAGLFAVFGEGEGTARALSVTFALACAVLVGLLAGHERRWTAAWLAAFLLLTNPYWVSKTREALLDSGMLFGFLGAWWGLRRGWGGCRHGWWFAGVCAAVGCLVKGPLPFLAWPLVIVENLSRSGRDLRVPWRSLGASLLLALLLVVPWYVAQILIHGWDWLGRFFGYSIGARFVRPIEGHVQPIWFYFAAAIQRAPMSLTITGLALLLLLRRDIRVSATVVGPALLLIVTALILSVSASKREVYLVFLAPPAAILAGIVFVKWSESFSCRTVVIGLIVLLALTAPAFFSQYRPTMNHGREHKAAGLAIRPHLNAGNDLAILEIPKQSLLFYSGALPPKGEEGHIVIVAPLDSPAFPDYGEIVFRGRNIEARLGPTNQ